MGNYPDKSQKNVKSKKLLPEQLSTIQQIDKRILKAFEYTGNVKMEFSEIAELTGMTKKKPNLSYHLKRLVDGKELSSEVTGMYVRTEKKEDPIGVTIWDILSKDNYSAKSSDQIMKYMEVLSPDFTKENLEDQLMHLQWVEHLPPAVSDERRVGINATSDVGAVKKYRIVFWRLPNTVCHVCRKKFKDDELVITQMTFSPGNEIVQFPLHATCRTTLAVPEAQPEDEREVSCSYCGLGLSPRHLGLKSEDIHNPLVMSAIEEIYDSPYSKLFPFLDAKLNYLDHISQVILRNATTSVDFVSGGDFEAIAYAYSVKNGDKYYHPYCAKRVEELSKEDEK